MPGRAPCFSSGARVFMTSSGTNGAMVGTESALPDPDKTRAAPRERARSRRACRTGSATNRSSGRNRARRAASRAPRAHAQARLQTSHRSRKLVAARPATRSTPADARRDQGHQREETERAAAHHVGEEAKQHADGERQHRVRHDAPAKHHHHHDERQDEGRVGRQAPTARRSRAPRTGPRARGGSALIAAACAAVLAPRSDRPRRRHAWRRCRPGCARTRAEPACGGVRRRRRSASPTADLRSDLPLDRCSRAAGVSKNSTLTTSSARRSACGRTLKAPCVPVTVPTRSPRGSTPSLPEV